MFLSTEGNQAGSALFHCCLCRPQNILSTILRRVICTDLTGRHRTNDGMENKTGPRWPDVLEDIRSEGGDVNGSEACINKTTRAVLRGKTALLPSFSPLPSPEKLIVRSTRHGYLLCALDLWIRTSGQASALFGIAAFCCSRSCLRFTRKRQALCLSESRRKRPHVHRAWRVTRSFIQPRGVRRGRRKRHW